MGNTANRPAPDASPTAPNALNTLNKANMTCKDHPKYRECPGLCDEMLSYRDDYEKNSSPKGSSLNLYLVACIPIFLSLLLAFLIWFKCKYATVKKRVPPMEKAEGTIAKSAPKSISKTSIQATTYEQQKFIEKQKEQEKADIASSKFTKKGKIKIPKEVTDEQLEVESKKEDDVLILPKVFYNEKDNEDDVVLPTNGVLKKWTNFVGGWQDRYFEIVGGNLVYYKSKADKTYGCRGSMALKNAVVTPHDFDECEFTVSMGDDVTWYMKAENAQSKMLWIGSLGRESNDSDYSSTSTKSHSRNPSLSSVLLTSDNAEVYQRNFKGA
ncbi:unnamed protein product [Caenorhabditis auriculariae]|uniref:PH domain-containing protein n=1 Tax=Caenorhabditis auriculariae TaxID=2777116 RepID=A0A8S1HHA0_9PELO|nr:unnamed protein product [Caenorhabditis auriculariae]